MKSQWTDNQSDKRSQRSNDSPTGMSIPERERQLIVMAENLKVQKEQNDELSQNLKNELHKIRLQREDLKMLETELNQQKLRMLLKFDKIKFLEDFYNQHRLSVPRTLESQDSQEEIHLNAEIDQSELNKLCGQIYLNHLKKLKYQKSRQQWALSSMINLVTWLRHKRMQTVENKLRYTLYQWKL